MARLRFALLCLGYLAKIPKEFIPLGDSDFVALRRLLFGSVLLRVIAHGIGVLEKLFV